MIEKSQTPFQAKSSLPTQPHPLEADPTPPSSSPLPKTPPILTPVVRQADPPTAPSERAPTPPPPPSDSPPTIIITRSPTSPHQLPPNSSLTDHPPTPTTSPTTSPTNKKPPAPPADSPTTPTSPENPITPKRPPSQPTLNKNNFFKAMIQLQINMCSDKRIPPATQLVYRVLSDLANRNYWLYPFEASRNDLKLLTGIRSNSDIDKAKQRLKDLGYIDFSGTPNKFTIYCPPGSQPGDQPGRSAAPHTPHLHTSIQSYQKTEILKKERRFASDVPSDPDQPTPPRTHTPLSAEQLDQLKHLEKCKRRSHN